MSDDAPLNANSAKRNRRVAMLCVAVFASMVGLAYASVPLYRLFCQVTGFGGTPQIATTGADIVREETIEVRFDANVAPGLAWDFAPETPSMRVKLGETVLAFYKARNTGDVQVMGTAAFNVTPEWAGAYFNKIECFCFTEQVLAAGENVDMPVTYFVDPAILDEVGGRELPAITLSYTFFAVETPAAATDKRQARAGGL